MEDIHDFLKRDKNAKILLNLDQEKISLKEKLWLLLNAIFIELPKSFILSFPSAIGALLRQLYFRYFFRDLGERCIFGDKLRILGEKNISIGSFTWIDHNVQLNASFGELKIGDRVHIAPYSILSAGGGIYIDDFVGISLLHISIHTQKYL